MIPMTLWFKFPCGSELAVHGLLHALPRAGELVSTDENGLYEWEVDEISHNLFDNRDLWIELGLSDRHDGPPWDKKRRVALRKLLVKSGWRLVSEVHEA
jgi:hypothetical protein